MEKKILRRNIGKEKEFDATDSYIVNSIDINEVIDFFVKAKEAGATHIEWYATSNYNGDSEYCTAQPFTEMEETDEELQIRLNAEEIAKREQFLEIAKKEIAEYKRLKAKFKMMGITDNELNS